MIESTGRESSTQLHAALLDETHEPVFALDTSGAIRYANVAAARFVGHDRERLPGKPFTTLLSPESRRDMELAFAEIPTSPRSLEVTLEGRTAHVPLTLRLLTGLDPPTIAATFVSEPIAVSVTGTLNRFFLRLPYAVIGLDPHLRVVFGNARARRLLRGSAFKAGMPLPVGPLRDFAQRVVAFEAVEETRRIELPDGRLIRASGLGPRGTEPAILIVEDVTSEAQDDRVMREFVRNAAHQLRTPLTGIAAAIEVLQAGAKDNPETRDRFLGHVEVHAQRLIRIARGLLVLARAEAGEPMQLEFVELRPLLDELAAQAQPLPGVDLEIACDPALAVLAERDLVREALAALVENAVQHTREGAIRMSAEETDGTVAVSVTDTGGAGVPPEHRERIFEPFYRLGTSGKGFGLGLAIARQATTAMNGELTVDDAERGARFTIRLPAGRASV